MIDSLYPIDKLDYVIKTKIKDEFNDLKEYIIEGDDYNQINFNRLLVFYDNRLFGKANIDINPVNRWTNAYYWYTVYIFELKKQGISIENHRQLRFKLLEQIDYFADTCFDWIIIESIDKEYDLK
jgi:hypothetical protein